MQSRGQLPEERHKCHNTFICMGLEKHNELTQLPQETAIVSDRVEFAGLIYRPPQEGLTRREPFPALIMPDEVHLPEARNRSGRGPMRQKGNPE